MSCRVRQLPHHNRDQEIHGIGSLRRVEGVSKRSEDVVSVFTRKVTYRQVRTGILQGIKIDHTYQEGSSCRR
jgi:hypothetical protein